MRQVLALFPFLLLLSSCRTASDDRRMAQIIAEADSMNRNFVPMTSDSLLQEACGYYDRHGTPNQRMMAHYLLGCVYRDRGEAPEALEAYHTAADCADTTASDCDYRRLSRVHGQMADLLYQQNLPNEMLDELNLFAKYAKKDGDTVAAIKAYSYRAGAYELLGMDDSVLSVLSTSYHAYKEVGEEHRASMDVCAIVPLLVERKRFVEAAEYLRDYENLPDLFDDEGTINSLHNIYYSIKGRYLLAVSQRDSAEHMFRKLLNMAQTANDLEGAYQGLLLLYKEKQNADSIAKYAELAYHLCDSVYKDDNMERLQQMQSLYNYNIHRQAAIKNAEKAKIARLWVIIAFLLLCFTIGFGCYYYYVQKRKKRTELEKLETAHKNDIQQIRKAQQDLMALHEQHYSELIEAKNCDIHALQFQLEEYQELQKHYQPESLEERLRSTASFSIFQEKLKHNINITAADWEQLHDDINTELPRFFGVLNARKPLSNTEYNLCILIRLGFQPKELHVLLDFPMSYNLTVLRKRLLMKIFGIEGTAKELDQRILSIT